MSSWLCKRRVLIISTIVLSFGLAAYISCYIMLRNRGLREATRYELPGMMYDSCSNVEKSRDLTAHHMRAVLFAPLNFVDRTFFGGKGPIAGIMWELS